MRLHAGIDLHANNSYAAVIDEKDELIVGKRYRNDLGLICKALEPYQEEIQERIPWMPFRSSWPLRTSWSGCLGRRSRLQNFRITSKHGGNGQPPESGGPRAYQTYRQVEQVSSGVLDARLSVNGKRVCEKDVSGKDPERGARAGARQKIGGDGKMTPVSRE